MVYCIPLCLYVYYKQKTVARPVPISCFIFFYQIEELYDAHFAWMVSSGHCKGCGAPLSLARNLQYFGSGNVVCRLSNVVCCRQQQLTAFRRVWPLADWREISKISIHKNSQECAHSHVLGMYSYVPLSATLSALSPPSLSLSVCPPVGSVQVCMSCLPAHRPSVCSTVVCNCFSQLRTPLQYPKCSFNSNYAPFNTPPLQPVRTFDYINLICPTAFQFI